MIRIASAATLAAALSFPVFTRGERHRTRAICHGGDGKANLLFHDPSKAGASLAVKCFSGHCDSDTIRHALQDASGLTLCRCDTCFRTAGQDGPAPPPRPHVTPKQPRPLEDVRRETYHWLRGARVDVHPYLVNKGLGHVKGFVSGRWLLIPMRNFDDMMIAGLQRIDTEGWKQFLPGTHASRAVTILGRGGPGHGHQWFVEGYSTGLSVLAAVPKTDRVVVCFSDHNLTQVAKGQKRGLVVADHDRYKCPDCNARWAGRYGAKACPTCGSMAILQPAGETAAIETGLPYYLPVDVGDANDVYTTQGADFLRAELARFTKEKEKP